MTSRSKISSIPNYCCPYCGKEVGYLGNWLAKLFGTQLHGCDFAISRHKFHENLLFLSNSANNTELIKSKIQAPDYNPTPGSKSTH